MGKKDLKTMKDMMGKVAKPETVASIKVSPALFRDIDRSTPRNGNFIIANELVWSFDNVDVPILEDSNIKGYDYRVARKTSDKQRWEIERMSNDNIKTFMDSVREIGEPGTVDSIEVSPFLYHELVRASKPSFSPEPATLTWGLSGGYRVPVFKALNLGGFHFRVLYKPVEERVEKQEVELLDMDEANNAIRKFEEAMQQVKETERLAKIAVGEKLYSALNSVDKGDVWLFEDFVDVPLQLDKSLGAYQHVLVYREPSNGYTPAPPKAKPVTMDEGTTLTNITINGIAFEDLTASVFYRNEGWQLLPAKGSDTELILFGFIKALSCLGAGEQDTRVTITGQDEHKPWIEYTGAFVLDGYSFSGKNRISNATFYGIDIQAIVNKDLEPSITAVLNEFEITEIIGSLIKEKRTADGNRVVHIDRAIRYFQVLLQEEGKPYSFADAIDFVESDEEGADE